MKAVVCTRYVPENEWGSTLMWSWSQYNIYIYSGGGFVFFWMKHSGEVLGINGWKVKILDEYICARLVPSHQCLILVLCVNMRVRYDFGVMCAHFSIIVARRRTNMRPLFYCQEVKCHKFWACPLFINYTLVLAHKTRALSELTSLLGCCLRQTSTKDRISQARPAFEFVVDC